MNLRPIFLLLPISALFFAFCSTAPSQVDEKSLDKSLRGNSIGVDNPCKTFDQLRQKHCNFEEENGEKNWENKKRTDEKMKNAKKGNQTKQKAKRKCNQSGGIIRQIGTLAMIPLLIVGAASSSTPLNASDFHLNKGTGLQMPFYGTANALQMSGSIYRNLSKDDPMNGPFCVIQLLSKDEIKLKREKEEEAKERNENNLVKLEKERTAAEMGEKIKMVHKKWEDKASAIINVERIFKKFGVQKDEEKLSLLEELSQRATGAKSRCDDQILLLEYGAIEKIGDSFFSIDRSNTLDDGQIKIYNGNSEHFGACVAVVEFNIANMHTQTVEKLKNEIDILKKLSTSSEHILRMFESDQNGKTFKMVTEVVRFNFAEVWYQSDVGKSVHTMKILFNEMVKALEEFHKNGTHLNINLTKFYFVEDGHTDKGKGNGKGSGNENEGQSVTLEIEGEKLKLKTKLADFGRAILFNTDTDYGSPFSAVYDYGTSAAFLCPEQISDAFALTPKCDIFSLGVVLYEMLAPQVGNPFRRMCSGKSDANAFDECVKQQIVHTNVPILVEQQNDGTEYLWGIVKASLQKGPNGRPNAKGIRKYLRGECRLHVQKDEFGINDDVPTERCDTE